MVAKEEEGCPTGFYSAYLVPGFVKDVGRTEFGLYPWYAGPNRIDQPIRPFPPGLMLITKVASYSFDIKSGSRYFYIASDRFINSLEGLRTNFLQTEEVTYVDYSGAAIAGRRQFAIRTKKVPKAVALDLARSVFSKDSPRRFDHISINASIDLDLFDVAGLGPNQVSLICSERAKTVFSDVGIKGVGFVEIEQIGRTDISREEIYPPPDYPVPI